MLPRLTLVAVAVAGAAALTTLANGGGEFDVIGCGAGRDTVVADRGDLVGRDCEHVRRSGT